MGLVKGKCEGSKLILAFINQILYTYTNRVYPVLSPFVRACSTHRDLKEGKQI
jgi:hypothetical protein